MGMTIGIPYSLKIRLGRLAKQNGVSVCALVEWGLCLYLDELENGGALKAGRSDAMVAMGNNRGKRHRNAPFLLCRRFMKKRRGDV
jgi:hypothetical protein